MDYNEGFKNGYKTAKAYSRRQRIRDYEKILGELRQKRKELSEECAKKKLFKFFTIYRIMHILDAELILENHIKELRHAE